MSKTIAVPIIPKPGVVKGDTERIAEGRYIDSDKIRSQSRLPEKIGGWIKSTLVATLGLPRTMHLWRDLQSSGFIGVGTYKKLYVYDPDFVQNDITPFRSTGTLGLDPFTTVNLSPVVSVAHVAHGVVEGDTIIFSGAAAVGGLNMNGTWTVTLVTNANAYTFTHTSNATSGATGGGAAVLFSYEINIGTEFAAFGLGWGVGGWGLGTWGSAHASSTVTFEARVWSLDNFGKILLSTYNTGRIYQFDPTQAKPWPRAQVIVDAPTDTRALFVTPERFVIALRDGMVLHGSSQNDYTTWTPAAANTAFTRTLTDGARLVAGRVLSPFISLVWSDSALYKLQYTGSQFVYNSSLAGKDCGLIAPNAAVTIDGVAFWMGADDFWMYAGSPQKMPNSEDIRKFVFNDIPANISFQCFAVYNPRFSEIYFGYPGTGATFPDKYVIYSIKDQAWWPGTLTRVAGHHFTQADTRPFFGDSDGFLYQHENGVDANGAAMEWLLQLAAYALPTDGMNGADVEGMLFDFKDQSGDITVVINTFDRLTDITAMDTETETIPDTLAGLTDMRVSGRYLSMTLSQSEVGGYMRMGKPVAFIKKAGGRR